MNYKKWDIILVPFPFTDLSTAKKRPALIISPDEYNNNLDVVITFLTSKLDSPSRLGDYKIKKWTEASLPKPSLIKMKFATVDKSIVVKKLGRLPEIDIKGLKHLLIDFFTK